MWVTIAPLGIAVVPEVKMICQTSSAWISTSGSAVDAPATKLGERATLPSTGAPPISIVTSGVIPRASNTPASLGHSSASTIENRGSVRSSR